MKRKVFTIYLVIIVSFCIPFSLTDISAQTIIWQDIKHFNKRSNWQSIVYLHDDNNFFCRKYLNEVLSDLEIISFVNQKFNSYKISPSYKGTIKTKDRGYHGRPNFKIEKEKIDQLIAKEFIPDYFSSLLKPLYGKEYDDTLSMIHDLNYYLDEYSVFEYYQVIIWNNIDETEYDHHLVLQITNGEKKYPCIGIFNRDHKLIYVIKGYKSVSETLDQLIKSSIISLKSDKNQKSKPY